MGSIRVLVGANRSTPTGRRPPTPTTDADQPTPTSKMSNAHASQVAAAIYLCVFEAQQSATKHAHPSSGSGSAVTGQPP